MLDKAEEPKKEKSTIKLKENHNAVPAAKTQ